MHTNALDRVLFLTLSFLFLCSSWTAGQPKYRIQSEKNRFLIENRVTKQVREFDMWSTRLANALFDSRFTDRVVANLDDYLRYGINTLSVGIQGGNLGSVDFNKLYPRVYNSNGSLKLECEVWSNLRRLLDETDRRGMVLIIQYWYFKRDENVPSETAVLEATRRITRWLEATGHQNYILDLVNEFGHTEYSKRSLFSTVDGALKLLNAVYEENPDLLAGMSPPGRLFSPEGYVSTSSGKKWVAATVTYSHNQPADPGNPSAYYLHGLPNDPFGKPYVNNEFNKQLGYEKTMQKNPRTGLYTLGHWNQATVDNYIKDLLEIRRLGGYANVFSHLQQYLTRDSVLPVAEIGPSGTQPETAAGGGEPSMHWLFEAIARIRKIGPIARRHDFNDQLTAGIETELEGRWKIANREFRQEDSNAALAYARVAGPSCTDLEISFEAAFLGEPGAGRIGIHLGAASPAGPAYRLLISQGQIVLDQIGGSLPTTAVLHARNLSDQYCLILREGRVSVKVNGTTLIDLDDITPLDGRNLLLVTRYASATFDNIRVGPFVSVTFDNGKTGEWEAADPKAWEVVTRAGPGGDKVWKVKLGGNEASHAVLDRILGDFEFQFEVDCQSALFTGLRFRTDDLVSPLGDGYLLRLMKDGTIALDRIEGPSSPPRELAFNWVSMNPASVLLRVAVDGSHIRVFVDGKPVLDAVDAGLPLTGGSLVLLAQGGPAQFDDFHLQTGSNLFPETGVNAMTPEPLGKGFSLMTLDPDGLLDHQDIKLLIDKRDSFGFQDVTYLLDSRLGLFEISLTPCAKGAMAKLLRTISIGHTGWVMRIVAVDHEGNTSITDLNLNAGSQDS